MNFKKVAPFLCIFTGGCDIPPDNIDISTKSIYRPEFAIGDKTIRAGTAFVVEYESKRVLLSAHHLFGKAGGLDAAMTWEELRDSSPTVIAHDIDSDEVKFSSSRFISIPNAKSISKQTAQNDITLFALNDEANVSALKLSDSAPRVGDTVYLFARLKKDSEGDQLLHGGTVTASTDDFLEYKYHNPLINPRATSGAPIVNENGEVVGINLGITGFSVVNWKGTGNPIIPIKRKLKQALPPAPY